MSQEDENINKIFLIETIDSNILRGILSLFIWNKITTPSANKLFYCKISTSWAEIRAFVYRCFYSQILHQLIRPELLSTAIQGQFVQLLNELVRRSPMHLFRLGMITTVDSSQLYIINGLTKQQVIKLFDNNDLIDEQIFEVEIKKLIDERCMLVTSRIAGLGKSTYIKNETEKSKKTQVKMFITGDISVHTLMENLRHSEIQSKPLTTALHINIGSVENVQELNEFFYCLLLFRCFRFGQIPIDVPANIPIYIELDSSLYLSNLKNDIIIFKYLKTKHIEQLEWNELNVNSTEVQWVVNYLQALKNKDIDKRDIKEESIIALDRSTCIKIFKEYFWKNRDYQFISWTQLSIFLLVYHKLFSDFSQCGYFMSSFQTHRTLRSDLLNSLMKSSNIFTSLSVENVRNKERTINSDEDEATLSDSVLEYDQLKPFTLIFTPSFDPLFIYKTKSDIPQSLEHAIRSHLNEMYAKYETTTEYVQRKGLLSWFLGPTPVQRVIQVLPSKETIQKQIDNLFIDLKLPNVAHKDFFIRLTKLSNKYFLSKPICERCFQQYDENDQQICPTCPDKSSLAKPESLQEKDIEAFQEKMSNKLELQYALSFDNYLKMLLIYSRIRSNLPVLVMGETGCGKTSLIQCLCGKILNDYMEVFHVHAGVTSKQIVEEMRKYMKAAQELLDENSDKRLWIFFDEFNTTPNIGILKEIICERTLFGESLPKNMVFLGACNPQRRIKQKQVPVEEIGIKKYHSNKRNQISGAQSSLLYSVVPIPETMLEHIWDYGFLKKDTEKPYIKTMLKARTNLESVSDEKWFECTQNLISESQEHFRKYDDQSSVSLRDVARFCLLYNWFNKLTLPDENRKKSASQLYTQLERATLLALFVCYYFRLDSSTKRKNYLKSVANSIKEIKPSISAELLDEFLNNEKMALVSQMKLDQGMARNRALTDNIFVLFTCILNRIPVILSGKPGSSKTSAMRIIAESLKGEDSEKTICKAQQGIITILYQGSTSCTSDSIIKIFKQAEKVMHAQNTRKMLPVIVFDEIGLAEISPSNPLKVLHSHLEIENCQYGFVGLSNWRLDAAKMNRAVYLSCPEPNEDDLILTAMSLSQANILDIAKNILLDNDNLIIKGLVAAYMSMCEHIVSENKGYYFGLRDYYALIRGIATDLVDRKNEEYDVYEIIRYHLSCNFDGIINESNFIWSKFCESIKREDMIKNYSSPTFSNFLHRCLSKRNGRFLMLVGDNESDFDYIQQYISIRYPCLQIKALIGSTLVGDLLPNGTYTEQYNIRKLTDVIFYTERDVTVFFRGLGHLYDNLYDLFNQNFTDKNKKKYCRIALGSIYHPRCLIHKEFYCVVFVKKKDLNNYDRPFLNRFEKHIINMNETITEDQKKVIEDLKNWIENLLPMKSNEWFPIHKHLFFEFNNAYIRNLTCEEFFKLNLPVNNDGNQITPDVIERCQDQMIRISSFDFALFLSLKPPTSDTNKLIQRYYAIHGDLSFASFIDQQFSQKKSFKLLIYTYTQLYHVINYDHITDYKELIEEIKLNYLQTELELIEKLKLHYQSKSTRSRLLCIRLDYRQNSQQISMLKHILLNEISSDTNHGVCLIFHLQRHKLSEIENDVYFNGWTRVMIDDLQKHRIIPENILISGSYKHLIMHLNVLNMDSDFNTLLHRCMTNLRYQILDSTLGITTEDRRAQLIRYLTSESDDKRTYDQSFYELIKEQLLVIIEKISNTSDQVQFANWCKDLFTDATNIGSCVSFNDALERTVSICLDRCLLLLLSHIENHSMLDSYIVHTDLKNEVGNKLRQLWWYCWTKITGMIDISLLSRINVSIPFAVDLHLPCARAEYEIIREIRQTVIHIDDDKRINFAYEQLREKSFYGEFIKEILNNSELFAHYYHDQLTLARNEANIHRLPTSFIQRLLTVNILQTNKDRLQLLLIDYKEFFEILRLYEISVPLIDEQNTVSDILHRQFFLHTIQRDSTLITNDKLYQLLSQDSNYYLIPPGSSDTSEETFDCGGNPYIEISLMNIVELLLLPTVIDRLTDLQQTMLTYGRFAQIMLKLLSFGHYEVKNFKKFNSIIRLASCISCLFTNDEATIVFKKLYRINGDCSQLNTCNQIHNFILSLYNIIHKQQSTVDEETIHETLSKLEVELLRNWLFDNDKNSYEILDIINKSDRNLWKFSSKLFDFINQRFGFLAIFNEDDWQIPNDDDIEKLKTDLVQSNDPMNKIELLLINTIYVRLIFNENYQSKFNGISPRKLTEVLEMGFDRFDNSLTTNDQIQNEKKLERICFIAWLKYYLLHYVYAYQNNITNEIIQNINLSLLRNTTPFCSTIKLYIIKHLCHLQNTTVYYLGKDCAEKEITWLQAMIPQSADANPQHSRKHVTLPTPIFVFAKSFKHIDDNLSKIKDSSAMIDLIQKCSKNQTETYCFIMWFVHYYTRYWISNVSTEKTSFEYTGEGVKEELIKHYDIIGQKLIFGLVNNFDENSYFHLNDSMSEKDLHSRLLVLNIIAALISFKLTKKPSFFSSLLFDTKLEMPQNYIEHFEQLFNIRDLSLDSNTLDYIDTYIKKQKLEGRSNIAENSLTHHFMNFLIQSIYLVLCELDCMPCSTSIIRHEYRKKIQDKYNQLEEHFLDVHQSYLWFYNLVIYIVNENFASKTEFHSNIELLEKLIIFHGPSAITEIKQYQSAYLDFVFGQEKNNQLVTFVDELIEDNDKYSLLNFFNFSNIHSIDVIDHFYRQLRLQYNYKTNYPITNLIFERLSDYDNIQYLYPIIQLINELIQKYDHQIKRADANKKTIGECLKNDENLEAIFKNCLDAWYAITLKEVQRERPPLEHNVKDCSLSMFLLNKNNEGKNMAITHTIKTLVDLQNSMFDCFYSNASKTTEDTEYQMIPVQSIQQRHLFNYGTKKLRQLLIEKALVINYMYGVSEQIIFNYDEIEWSLRNEINCLSKIDMKNTRNLNYQYELYDENFSLFSEIRKRFLLILFSASKRDELREKLKNFEASDIVKISESLNYILSLLCATNIKNISEVSTIKTFIDKHIQLKECIHEKLADGMFGSIELVSIIDLYELVEETRFDKTLRKQFEQKLDTGLNLKPTDRTNILNQFMETVLNNKNGPTSLKNIHSWIGMFKRLLVRVCSLIMSNNYNSPLQVYVRRTDMWKSDISEESIETIKMEDNICLKHAYIILERLETDTLPAKQNKTAGNKVPKNKKMTYDG